MNVYQMRACFKDQRYSAPIPSHDVCMVLSGIYCPDCKPLWRCLADANGMLVEEQTFAHL